MVARLIRTGINGPTRAASAWIGAGPTLDSRPGDEWRAFSFLAATVLRLADLYLSHRGHDVTIVDNLSRRKIDVELEVDR